LLVVDYLNLMESGRREERREREVATITMALQHLAGELRIAESLPHCNLGWGDRSRSSESMNPLTPSCNISGSPRFWKLGMERIESAIPGVEASWWLRLVTPLQARVGRELIEGVRHATVVSDDLALRTFAIRPAGIRKAIADALRAEDVEFSATRWSNALSKIPPNSPWGGVRIGNHLLVSQTVEVEATPAMAFAPIRPSF
jgi:hypothetical protein